MMKNLYIILLLTVFSCNSGSSTNLTNAEDEASESDFDWLLGDWVRVNEEGEKETYESWEKVNASTYRGFGFTLLKNDTVWQEDIRLLKTVEGWSFEVTGKGDSTPTIFKLTDRAKESFTSQNPEHDFPTEIRYFKSGEALMAIISGQAMDIPFEFEKVVKKDEIVIK